MKKILNISIVLAALFLLNGCSSDDNSDSKIEKEWIDFVQKHLIGTWEPQQIDVKPIVGKAVLSSPYPHRPSCDKDELVLNRDFTGSFSHLSTGCTAVVADLTWHHRLGELSFTLKDGRVLPMIILKKSEKVLVLALPAKAVREQLIRVFPEVAYIEDADLELLLATITLFKV